MAAQRPVLILLLGSCSFDLQNDTLVFRLNLKSVFFGLMINVFFLKRTSYTSLLTLDLPKICAPANKLWRSLPSMTWEKTQADTFHPSVQFGLRVCGAWRTEEVRVHISWRGQVFVYKMVICSVENVDSTPIVVGPGERAVPAVSVTTSEASCIDDPWPRSCTYAEITLLWHSQWSRLFSHHPFSHPMLFTLSYHSVLSLCLSRLWKKDILIWEWQRWVSAKQFRMFLARDIVCQDLDKCQLNLFLCNRLTSLG